MSASANLGPDNRSELLTLRPRAYQWEVYEEATKKNIIAYLDTGSGKTLISVLLIKHISQQLAARDERKLIFFLAPKVELVKQQAEVLRLHTDLDVGDYVGEMGIDAWDKKRWLKIFTARQVMVCTPQVMLNLLRSAFLKISDVALVVFDECHHCKKKAPYNCIMEEFYFDTLLAVADRPKIFGMTASPIDTKSQLRPGQVRQFFETLESSLNAKIITVKDQEKVKKAAPLPTISKLEYDNMAPGNPTLEAINWVKQIRERTLLEAGRRKTEALSRLARLAPDGQTLDRENLDTETDVFSRSLGKIVHVLEEVGAYGALVAFGEVLTPSQKSIYAQMGSDSQRQHASLANLKQADLDMIPEAVDKDAWWEGREVQGGEYSRRGKDLSAREDKSLCSLLSITYEAFRQLMEKLTKQNGILPMLTDAQIEEYHWEGMREELRGYIKACEGALDKALLASHLMQQQEPSLVVPKASALARYLERYREPCTRAMTQPGEKWSCFIFAEQKITCLALSRLLQACEQHLGFLKTDCLMGFGGQVSALSQSNAVQQQILQDFKDGKLNAVVATAIAEEGLDICHCSLVVRYSLPPTPREFIQSRGRARRPGSTMALMLQAGSAAHSSFLQTVQQAEQEMLLQAQKRAGLAGPDEEVDVTEEDVKHLKTSNQEYRVASTGAKASLSSAKSLLYQYCDKLPCDSYTMQLRPRFSTTQGPEVNQFQSTVYLPNNCPVSQARGFRQQKRSIAVSSACLEAVKLLHKAKALTDHLVFDPDVPEMEDDEVEIGPNRTLRESSATRLCPIAPKWPEALKHPTPHSAVRSYHLYRVALKEEGEVPYRASEALSHPLGVLAPTHLGELPPVRVVLDNGVKVKMIFQYLSEAGLNLEQQKQVKVYHNFLIHRKVTLKELMTDVRPSPKKTKKEVKLEQQQQFQERQSTSKDVTAEGGDDNAPLRFYEAALAPAKAYEQSHGSLPTDCSQEEQHRLRTRKETAQPAAAPDDWSHLLEKLCTLSTSDGASNRNEGTNAKDPVRGGSTEDTVGNAADSTLPATVPTTPASPREDDPADGAEMIGSHKEEKEVEGLPVAGAFVLPLQTADQTFVIDWAAIQFANSRPQELEDLPPEAFHDRLVLPIYSQESQYYKVIRRHPDLTLTSVMPPRSKRKINAATVPADAPSPEQSVLESPARKPRRKTFREHFEQHWMVTGLKDEQYMLEVSHLNANSDRAVFLPPQLCEMHPLSIPAFLVAKHVPRILWWLFCLVAAKELREKLLPQNTDEKQRQLPDIGAFVEALMPKVCQQDQSYERLEIIGDAFLKFETTVHCFRAFPLCHEGQLHNVKIKLVCNKHLANIALNLKKMTLDKYIFIPGRFFKWDVGHPLPITEFKRKVVADVLEALIGAFAMAGGAEEVSDFLRRILLLPEETRHPTPRPPPPYQPSATGMASKLEKLLNYRFKDQSLLKEACTHPSWKESNSPCYQRLEFLGDAVLDLMVTETLAKRYPDIEAGKVNDIREAAVNNVRLGCVAAAHRCHHALRHCSAHLMRDMGNFVQLFDRTLRDHTPAEELPQVETGNKKANDRALSRTYDALTDRSYGLEMAVAPKAMADMVESLTGAIFIDSNCRIEPVFEVLHAMLTPLPSPETVAIHPIRVLMELVTRRHFTLRFSIQRRSDKTFNVHAFVNLYLIASAKEHQSTKSAKIAASRLAVERWSEEFDYGAASGQAFDTADTRTAATFAAARPALAQDAPGRMTIMEPDAQLVRERQPVF